MRYFRNLSRYKNWRIFSAIITDVIMACLAWAIAFNFRFNFSIPPAFLLSLKQVILWSVPLQISFFFMYGMYRGVWRFASLPDLKRICAAVFTSTFAIGLILLMVRPEAVVPRSVVLANPLLLILMLGGSRLIYRVWKDHKLYGHNLKRGKPVLLLGAGDHIDNVAKDLSRSSDWHVVGILHDKRQLHGLRLQNVKILGEISQLPYFAEQYDVEDVIVAMPSNSKSNKRKAIALATEHDLNVLTLPPFDDIINFHVNLAKIRPVEVEDLLGRDEVQLDDSSLHAMVDNKVVLVSGAGGSIGSELCRQILQFKPVTLVCLDLSEYALYKIEQELNAAFADTQLIFLTGDVKNVRRIKQVLATYMPNVVFHAAAYKHVPLMENDNVFEALSNNVIGTHTIAKACQAADVEKFVLISTDKAVNPTNIMGASKRLAEMVCQGLQSAAKDMKTEFVIVRFGNVLGSSGSVIPKFREQIANGGPITITHPDITRYFMSISEASQLVMQAGAMGNGGEIYVLDMGEPVKIMRLAQDMIRLSGFHEDEVKIEVTGLRPGEKLYEELLADDETTIPTNNAQLRIAKSRSVDNVWLESLLKWLLSAAHMSESQIKIEMKFWVEEYNMQTSSVTNDERKNPDSPVTIH